MHRTIVVILAVALDHFAGEVASQIHPLPKFGDLASALERRFNQYTTDSASINKTMGAAVVALLILPFTLLAWGLTHFPVLDVVTEVAVLYFALGNRSLSEHAYAVAEELAKGDLTQARERVSFLVSRDTSTLDETGVNRAAIESVLENGNDAVLAPVFWFFVLGAPGVVLYRLANTLDAMWGYKTAQYRNFGWAAARLDDLLNWVPARLTAITYSAMGNWTRGLRCWQEQGKKWLSPNAGPVMAAGSGALEVQVGGPATYHGVLLQERPYLGEGPPPQTPDIPRALKLVQKSLVAWMVATAAVALLLRI